MLLGSLWGGVMADRPPLPPDRGARGAAALAFAGLAVNAMLPDPTLWGIYVWVAWDGLATGVSVTALMAVAPTLVPPDQLPAAGALISLTGELGSISAPFLGGVLLALWGPGPVFAFTAVTTVLISRIRPLPPVEADGDGEEGTEYGADSGSLLVVFKQAVRNRVVGGLLALGGVMALFNLPVVLFPELVDRHFHGGEAMLGLLYTAPAVGAVAVGATSGWAHPGRPARPTLLAVGGAAGTVYEILEYALVQHSTPDRLRGRIVSVITTQGSTGGVVGDVEVATLAVAVAVPGLRRATLLHDERNEGDGHDGDGPGSGPDTADLKPATPAAPAG